MKSFWVTCAAVLLSACTTTSPDVIDRSNAQRLSAVVDATVLSVRSVTVDGTQSGLGAATGGLIGGVAGSTVGGQRESLVVGVVGAVVGGVIGNATERASTKEDAVEILVQLRSGERRAIVQAKGKEALQAGDAVILITTDAKTRVSRAPVKTTTP
jgi:outer membrane lipoprotein SlyB